ncbi:MAG: hypothetical protein NTZ12_11755 [Candidatus Aminicenantes bacterium]|nr:hypothetical protein [Candidatus Aminicenantes bacterium]
MTFFHPDSAAENPDSDQQNKNKECSQKQRAYLGTKKMIFYRKVRGQITQAEKKSDSHRQSKKEEMPEYTPERGPAVARIFRGIRFTHAGILEIIV